jgi:hypothetical protein
MEELDELRLKIALARGWKFVQDEYGWDAVRPDGSEDLGASMMRTEELAILYADIPNWPRDMTAAYELEAEIPEDQRKAYTSELIAVIARDCKKAGVNSDYWMYFHATPEQRCRAYIQWIEAQAEQQTKKD